MSTLAEIEQAAETLPPEQQQELLLFPATRLHGKGGALPPPRDIPLEPIEKWIAADEAGHRCFLAPRENERIDPSPVTQYVSGHERR